VIPFVADVDGTGAGFERIGERGIALHWTLPGGTLHADAQLGDASETPFPERLPGTTFFSTHGEAYAGGRAPAWSVRWSRA
jgi:hypothetical protein